jgi:hypothetical protein
MQLNKVQQMGIHYSVVVVDKPINVPVDFFQGCLYPKQHYDMYNMGESSAD